jgi:hypothetical protein
VAGCAMTAGFKLANQGVDTRSLQAYLGHKNIQHTVRYTELDPNRFRTSGRTEATVPECFCHVASASPPA